MLHQYTCRLIVFFQILLFIPAVSYGRTLDSLKGLSNKNLLYRAKAYHNKIYLIELGKRKMLRAEQKEMYIVWGDLAMNEKKYNEARLFYEKVLSLSNHHHDELDAYIKLCEVHFMLGNSAVSSDYMNKAMTLIHDIPSGNDKFEIQLFALSIYAHSGDVSVYKKKLEQLNTDIENSLLKENTNSEIKRSYKLQGNIYLELAKIHTSLLEIKKARKYLDSAKMVLLKSSMSRPDELEFKLKYQEAQNEHYAKNYERSNQLFLILLKDAEKFKMEHYAYVSKVYISMNFYHLKNYTDSLYFAEYALQNQAPITDYTEDYELMALRYAFIASGKLKLTEKANKYESLLINKTNGNKNFLREQFIHSYVNKINAYEAEQKNKRLRKILFYGLGIALFLAMSSYIYLRYKSNLKVKKFCDEFVKENEVEAVQKNKPKPKKEKTTDIDDKTAKILEKLSDFENGTCFLEKNFSIASLAAYLNTNSVTLSSVINTYKQSNFNDYVNGLRIDYIINQMKKNPKYLTYKISYLAEESGFSSHSIFTKAFKKKTNLTPSQFIESIKED